MKRLLKCKEGTRFGFPLAVLLMFIAMMVFIPGRDIMLPGARASASKSAKATLPPPAPEGEVQCDTLQTNPCYTVDPPNFNKIARAGSEQPRQFTVITNSRAGGCDQIVPRLFTAQATAPSWIQDVRVLSDDDSRFLTVTFLVRQNRNKDRQGSIEVLKEGQIVACVPISQDGCSYSISPTESALLSADPQTPPPFTVTTAPDNQCDYEVRTGSGFIDIKPEDAGNQTGTKAINYSVKENTTTEEKEGFITISEINNGAELASHRVRQQGKTVSPGGCIYSLSEPGFTFQPDGGERTFQVQTSEACDWTAVSDVSWIKLIDQQNVARAEISGRGEGNVRFRVDPTDSFRPGSISIVDAQGRPVGTYEVRQFGRTPDPGDPCSSIPILPQSAPFEFPADGGEGFFEIEAGPGCRWTARPNVPWVRIKVGEGDTRPEISGTGNRRINYVVSKNDDRDVSTTGRIDVLDTAGRVANFHSLRQKARELPDPTCAFTIPTPEAFVGEGGGTFSFTVAEEPGSVCDLSPDSGRFTWITNFQRKKNGEWQYDVRPWNDAPSDEPQRVGVITIGDKTYRVTQFPGGASGRSTNSGDCPSNGIRLNQIYNGTLSRETARPDCASKRKNGFRIDNYRLVITERTRVAINVAAVGFDPVVTLLSAGLKIDDDGGGFRNSRLPRLPRKEEFIALSPGEYTIEISSFQSAIVGSYALYVASDEATPEPVILGAAVEGETLIVIGENFDKKTKLFIGDGTDPEPSTKNAQSRKRTALVALRSGAKVKKDAPVSLRVVNQSGKESARFVFPKQ